MIDIDKFLTDIHPPMLAHSKAPQIVLGNQKVPIEQLQENRIVYNVIVFADTRPRHTIIHQEEVVDYDPEYWEEGPVFDNDILCYMISCPQATLSFTGYGPQARNNIGRLREWWHTPGLADRWLKENEMGCVIREIMSISDRTVYLETDYERRMGFDVIVEFKDVVAVRERTIEKVKLIGDSEKTLEL